MASYARIDEDIDRDVRLALLPTLYAAALPKDEAQFGLQSHQINTKDWGLTALEEPDRTVNLEATIEQTANMASALPCGNTDGSYQNCEAPYLPWHISVIHQENLPENQVLWLGENATGTFNRQHEAHQPITSQLFAHGGFTGFSDPITDGNTTMPDTNNLGRTGRTSPSMGGSRQELRNAVTLAQELTSNGRYGNFLTPGLDGSPQGLHDAKISGTAADIPFRVETKRVYICTHTGCNKKYSRMPDLRRHYRGSHLDDCRFQCRALGCGRAIRGFPRRDKRDVHEKKMHIDIGDGILL